MRVCLITASTMSLTVLLLAATTPAFAQSEVGASSNASQPQSQAAAENPHEWHFTFGGGFTHRFDSDVDSGGDVSVNTFSAGLDAATQLNADVGLDLRFNYGIADYSFGGSTGFGGLNPWSDIHTITFGAIITMNIDNRWTVFGGPIFQFARETGADWGDSFTGGALLGATYKARDNLLIGGGIAITSQIEDNARFFPILVFEWGFADHWRISSRGPSGGRTSLEFTGLELICDPCPQWEFALGGGSSYSRFRLDNDGVAPNGVGQDDSTPFWLRASWHPTGDISVDALAGYLFGGGLSLDNSHGHGVASSDYDGTLFVGLFGSIRF